MYTAKDLQADATMVGKIQRVPLREVWKHEAMIASMVRLEKALSPHIAKLRT